MELEGVIEIKKPDPDSHYRLRPCRICKGGNVAYVQYQAVDNEVWRVQCFDCGHTVDKGYTVRHDAQLAWNEGRISGPGMQRAKGA